MNIAFIPVRGGSKSVPLKNIKNIYGKPLVYWAVNAAQHSKVIDKVVVATDHIDIKNTVISFGFNKVEVYDREPINAQDTSPTMDVILEYIEKKNINDEDIMFLIQATSPLIEPTHIDDMYKKMLKENSQSALTCVECKRFFWTKDGKPINYDHKVRIRRQDFEGYMMENGACYINSIFNLKTTKNLLKEPITIYSMPEYTATELDEELDFFIIEKLFEKYKYQTRPDQTRPDQTRP
ncbi:hypothetical protein BHAMNSH16_00320 [Brachyspira hampsonii]|uniref:Acylneuraminate cytidylyltransferase n=2 Tax=Brachyspira hampsonii TaxID=1287055 RepID=A0AAC9TS63_9SPIR|nr:acylneuraminate cytidylyltransferase family protein [Brachyspira hampsonii]ASJ20179.1 hypothetical protein BHAMNSH16_00320 [Brachyspira hampsonii]OEJ17007.1 hypothetical protein A9496_11905 [Brachyspira hampsonii]